jgi:tight adherence protein C
MDTATTIPIVTFIAIALGIWGLGGLFRKQRSRAAERLDELRDPMSRQRREMQKNTKVGNVIERAAPALSKALQPKSEAEQSSLRIRLANAGYSTPNAPRNYLAIKAVFLGFGLMVGGTYGFVSAGLSSNSWMSLGIGGAIGFYLPSLAILILKSSRKQKIFLQLPDALDLLVVCVEAGLGLDSGMRRISDELEASAPEICKELAAANMQLQMGRPRREVLKDLGVRTGVDDVKALAAILIQADKFGASIAQALRVQSDTMRVKRRQMAEEKAAATAVKMIFPLVLFIFPGIFVVLVGPAAIQLMENIINK